MKNDRLKSRFDKAVNDDEIEILPHGKFKNPKDFTQAFDKVDGKIGYIITPYKEIKMRIAYAYRHFYENTYNKNRDNIKSAFFETFKNPLFITKEMRDGKESLYFYKPFYDENKNIIHLFGVGVDSENKVDFRTFYWDEKETRIEKILKNKDENIIYIKK